MLQSIKKLYTIAHKKSRVIIGLMSGTSVDGLDVALCKITGANGRTKVNVLHFESVVYKPIYKQKVASIFSKQQVNLEELTLINAWIGTQHANIILQCLRKWGIAPSKIDCIASHGQTIYHAPKSLHLKKAYSNATLQLGDGDHIARTTGILTISDFRQKHIAAGGEGAPLAVYGDYLLFGKKGADRIMLNIGGIANFTYLPKSNKATQVFSTDVGPGNTIMDAYMKAKYNKAYDKHGAVAASGITHAALLAALKQNVFFTKNFPKTTGPELFNLDYLVQAMHQAKLKALPTQDVMSTLNQFTADVIVDSIIKSFGARTTATIYSSGGGLHNTLLMQRIQAQLPHAKFTTTQALHILPDAKEAVLFALLANQTLAGNNTFTTQNKDIPNVSMGKVSFAE